MVKFQTKKNTVEVGKYFILNGNTILVKGTMEVLFKRYAIAYIAAIRFLNDKFGSCILTLRILSESPYIEFLTTSLWHIYFVENGENKGDNAIYNFSHFDDIFLCDLKGFEVDLMINGYKCDYPELDSFSYLQPLIKEYLFTRRDFELYDKEVKSL